MALLLLLGGYMFFGRPFAYIHVPGIPVYIGEIVLGIGLYQALGTLSGTRWLLVRSPILRTFGLLLALTLVRLAVDLPVYGLDAVRDSALLYYALNAMLVATIIRRDRTVIDFWFSWYDRVLPFYLCYAPLSVVLQRSFAGSAPVVPDSATSILDVKAGDVATFCALAIAYLWLRPAPQGSFLARHSTALTTVGFVGILVAGTQNRGGLLTATLVLGIALCLSARRTSIVFKGALALAAVLVLALALDLRVSLGSARRELSVAQLGDNLASVMNPGAPEAQDEDALAGTVQWRTDFWADILEENAFGERAITGVGFGVNLAERYDLAARSGEQALRNAHNSHLSVLARLGLPGIALWLLAWAALAVEWTKAYRRLGASANHAWLLLWVGAALPGLLFNAIFDPTLEGPQIAFWLWALVGIASQAVRVPAIAAHQPDGGERADLPTTSPRPVMQGVRQAAASRR